MPPSPSPEQRLGQLPQLWKSCSLTAVDPALIASNAHLSKILRTFFSFLTLTGFRKYSCYAATYSSFGFFFFFFCPCAITATVQCRQFHHHLSTCWVLALTRIVHQEWNITTTSSVSANSDTLVSRDMRLVTKNSAIHLEKKLHVHLLLSSEKTGWQKVMEGQVRWHGASVELRRGIKRSISIHRLTAFSQTFNLYSTLCTRPQRTNTEKLDLFWI